MFPIKRGIDSEVEKVKGLNSREKKMFLTPSKFLTVSCLLMLSLGLNSSVKAATLDDLKELLGTERTDAIYSEEEKKNIIDKYNKIEENNKLYALYESNEVKLLNKAVLEAKAKYVKLLKDKEQEITEAFDSDMTPDKILSLRSALSTLEHQKNSIRDEHDLMNIAYIENDVADEYKKVMANIAVVKKEAEKDLGEVGASLVSPLVDTMIINSPYGYRIHPITGKVEMHRGIDLKSKLGDAVHSQWFGVVSRVYSTETGGLSINVDHGNGIETRYLHLSQQLVAEGQSVEQYTKIGEVGSTGASTGPHLHFEVLIDGKNVNPIYFYGKMGADMLNAYIGTTTDPFHLSLKPLVYEIKRDPDWLAKEREVNRPSYAQGPREVDIVYPSKVKPSGSLDVQLEDGFKFTKPTDVIR